MADKVADPAIENEESSPPLEEQDEEFVFVEDPQFDVDYKGDCAYEVKVTVPTANRKKQADELFSELSEEAEVPGFRRGRAPRQLIERKFSKAVQTEVEGKLVNAAFKKLVKDQDLHPISVPDIEGIDEENKEQRADEPLTFTLKFEVAPRVELGKYRGVEVERPILKVTKKDVKDAVDRLRDRYAAYETVKKGKAATEDQIVIDFKGTIDGEAFSGGSATDYPYILGTKRFFPEFEAVLEGSTTGDELSCEVTFPEDYHAEALRGKTAQFAITVKEIKRRKVPKLTDEFATQAGFENAADLQEKVEDQLREGSAQQSDRIAEARALDAVIAASTYEIPKSVLESVVEELYEENTRRLLANRVPRGEIESRSEELRKQAEEAALSDIKRMTTLNEIGDAEGVEVTDEDFEQEFSDIARRAGVSSDVVGQYLQQEGQLSTYEGRIFRSKALSIIMEHAIVTDKEVSRKELSEESEDNQELEEDDTDEA